MPYLERAASDDRGLTSSTREEHVTFRTVIAGGRRGTRLDEPRRFFMIHRITWANLPKCHACYR